MSAEFPAVPTRCASLTPSLLLSAIDFFMSSLMVLQRCDSWAAAAHAASDESRDVIVDAPRSARDLSVTPAGAEGAPMPDAPALGRNSTRSLDGVTSVSRAGGSVGTVAVSVRGEVVGATGKTGSAVGGTGVGHGAVRSWTGFSRGRGAGGRGAGGGRNVTRVCVRLSSSSERNRALSDSEVIETSAARNRTAVAMPDAAISVHRGERRGKSNGYLRRSAVCTGNGGRGIRTPKSFRTP